MGYDSSNAAGLEYIDISDATQVNSAGGTKTESLTPPAGVLYEIHGLMISIPDPIGSAANEHLLFIHPMGETDLKGILINVSSNTGTDISYVGRYGFQGTSIAPSSIDNQRHALEMLMVSNSLPLLFRYVNNTDAHQTGTRTIKVLVKKTREGFA